MRLPTLFEAVLAAALGLLALRLIQPSVRAGTRAKAESVALEALRRIARAEGAFGPAGGPQLLSRLLPSKGAQLFPGRGERVLDDGTVEWRGYCFRTYLPAADGRGTVVPAEVDATRARTCIAIYAWPVEGISSGMRVFLAHGGSDFRLHATENARGTYRGAEGAPAPGAAFKDGRTGLICGSIPSDAPATDGLDWRPLPPER